MQLLPLPITLLCIIVSTSWIGCGYFGDNYTPNTDFNDKKLYINGFITPDSIVIAVGKTASPVGTLPKREIAFQIDEATVWVQGKGDTSKIWLEKKKSGKYCSYNVDLKPGESYAVYASAKGFDNAFSDYVTIPEKIKLTTMDISYSISTDKQVFSILIPYYDPLPKKVNYFYIETLNKTTDPKQKGTNQYFDLAEDFQKKCHFDYSFPYRFSDFCIDGQPFIIPLTLPKNSITSDSILFNYGEIDSLYFEYFNQLQQPYSGLELAFSDFIPFVGNINNGYGLVTATNFSAFKLPVR